MRKIFTLFILLLLLPATALAAGAPSGQTIYVGGKEVTSGGYWTTDSAGNVTAYSGTEAPTDNYIHYDAGDNTLTLHNAIIKEALDYGYNPPNSLIPGAAIGVLNQKDDAELTITLVGTNTIAKVSTGIFVLASSAGGATLTITGDGNLTASGSSHGILVQSNSGDAALTIRNADVTAENSSYSGDGVTVRAGSSSSASLSVDGGSLTATGKNENGAGIRYTFGSSSSGSGKPSLTVSNSAIVKASGGKGGISDNSSTDIKIGVGDNSSGGIVFDGNKGTVYGSVTLQEDLEIGEGESLTLDSGASLDAGDYDVIVDGGTLDENLANSLGNNVKYAPAITTESLTTGEVGTAYSQDLTATGDTPITWNLASGSSLPAGLSLSEDGKITGKPTTDGTFTFTVTATNDSGSDSKDFTLKIDKPAFIPVTGLELNKSTLTLQEKGSYALTTTAKPDNATNKNVTWESSDTSIATVDANGTVTAISAGTATITVTAQDGSGVNTSCSVTVTHSMVHTPKKDATCTEDGNIEYWYCKNCDKYFSDENATEGLSDVVIPATGHHYVNGYCTKCGHRDPDYRPDPISYYNIYVEDVCDGVEVTLSNNVVREGNSISVYVKKDTANYTFDNFKVYYKRSYYGGWEELKEGTQPGEYPIKNIWTHIYIKAEGAEEKEDPTGIESIEGVKVYTKDGSLYVQTPQREQVIIVSMNGAVVKNEEQVGLKQYHGLQPGIYIVRVGDRAYKLRLN